MVMLLIIDVIICDVYAQIVTVNYQHINLKTSIVLENIVKYIMIDLMEKGYLLKLVKRTVC